MSVNKYMHPRNIYKQPPNFKQLAIEFPEFRKYVSQDISGKISMDFKNAEGLRALTCTLLKKDFDLDLDIPLNKLIPTIPLRLNYILWLEDLLHVAKCGGTIKGIDIGTGASCIYPLLGAKKNKWSMIATEMDEESISYAVKNVSKNCLEDLVQVVQVKGDSLLTELLATHSTAIVYDFCMCNPPFFGSTAELLPFFRARKQNRPHPRNAFCASVDEVVVKGGEAEYISKLIQESQQVGLQIKIYTTMIGQKSNLGRLKQSLREIGVVSFKQTEFCQGHTTRWGLAWTFHEIDLRKIPDGLIAAKHQLKPLLYQIPNETDIEVVSERLKKLFQGLKIQVENFKRISKKCLEYTITAYANTWSHQRRKRREQKISPESSSTDFHETCDKFAEMEMAELDRNKNKRELEDEDEFFQSKKAKTNNAPNAFLKCTIEVRKEQDCLYLNFTFIEGIGGKEAMNQVLQYIKNNLDR